MAFQVLARARSVRACVLVHAHACVRLLLCGMRYDDLEISVREHRDLVLLIAPQFFRRCLCLSCIVRQLVAQDFVGASDVDELSARRVRRTDHHRDLVPIGTLVDRHLASCRVLLRHLIIDVLQHLIEITTSWPMCIRECPRT